MRLTLSFVRCLLLLVAVCCDTGLHAQDGRMWDVPRVGGETISELSPDATAMRRYQDFPVSYATGTADISIPLLELPGGRIGVSLGLRYHTGGIKRNDRTLFSRPDDLAGKYPHLNPYLYCTANPIKFVDKTGKYFVDATGTKVTYNTQTQTWSANATTDIKRYASFMQKTEIGTEILNNIISSNIIGTHANDLQDLGSSQKQKEAREIRANENQFKAINEIKKR